MLKEMGTAPIFPSGSGPHTCDARALSSTAMSLPELPKPITSTFFPLNFSGSLYSRLWK